MRTKEPGDVDPRVQNVVNKIAREIISTECYFTDEDDDNILGLIDAKEDIMSNEEQKSTEDIKKETLDVKKEILTAIEAYNKAVAKKKKRDEDSTRGLTHFMGRYGPDDDEVDENMEDGDDT